MLRVVVAEDNLLVREGIVGLLALETDIDVVAQCTSYDTLLAAVEDLEPDVVLTDIRMPPDHSDEGVRAATILRQSHPAIGVLVLTQHDTPDFALRVFEDGAAGRGYLLKEHVAERDQLVLALRHVAEGGSSIDPTIVETMLAARA